MRNILEDKKETLLKRSEKGNISKLLKHIMWRILLFSQNYHSNRFYSMRYRNSKKFCNLLRKF